MYGFLAILGCTLSFYCQHSATEHLLLRTIAMQGVGPMALFSTQRGQLNG